MREPSGPLPDVFGRDRHPGGVEHVQVDLLVELAVPQRGPGQPGQVIQIAHV